MHRKINNRPNGWHGFPTDWAIVTSKRVKLLQNLHLERAIVEESHAVK